MPLVASLRPSAAPVAPSASSVVTAKSPTRDSKEHNESKPKSANPVPLTTSTEPLRARPQDIPDSTAGLATGSEAPVPRPAPEAQAAVPSALLPAAGLDADGLRSYRLSLAREAKRHRRYPSQAIEAAWSGTVELRVSVPAGLGRPAVQLAKSSGFPMLDVAALEMLRQAIPTTPIPAPLQERGFAVDLPIVFELPQ